MNHSEEIITFVNILKIMGSLLTSETTNFPLGNISIISMVSDLPLYKNKSFLQQKYSVEKLTCEEIATTIFSARTTVLKYLKLFDIPIREVGSNRVRKRGVPYGGKYIQRQETEHKRELENIKKMRELRDKGFSYWKIAEIFNSMSIPTKSRKGRWHAKSIHQILNRLVV